MKLATFKTGKNPRPVFGILIEETLYPFDLLCRRFRVQAPHLASMRTYLENLPASFRSAAALQKRLEQSKKPLRGLRGHSLDTVNLLPPVAEPAALLDFGLTPRHLANSARTLFRYEMPWPVNHIALALIGRRMRRIDKDLLLYYKGNHNELIGHRETTRWPRYTSYLDIEPELAFVTGRENGRTVAAGYCILNDFSARDVQFPEMIGPGLARSKDLARGNGLGPVLVTPDEAGDVLALDVSVKAGDRFHWKGSTAEYAASAEDIIRFVEGVFPLRAGTVIGMGTIPGCCGLDNDLWVLPGERVDITFDRLGTLTQHIPAEIEELLPSRWPERKELRGYYRG